MQNSTCNSYTAAFYTAAFYTVEGQEITNIESVHHDMQLDFLIAHYEQQNAQLITVGISTALLAIKMAVPIRKTKNGVQKRQEEIRILLFKSLAVQSM